MSLELFTPVEKVGDDLTRSKDSTFPIKEIGYPEAALLIAGKPECLIAFSDGLAVCNGLAIAAFNAEGAPALYLSHTYPSIPHTHKSQGRKMPALEGAEVALDFLESRRYRVFGAHLFRISVDNSYESLDDECIDDQERLNTNLADLLHAYGVELGVHNYQHPVRQRAVLDSKSRTLTSTSNYKQVLSDTAAQLKAAL